MFLPLSDAPNPQRIAWVTYGLIAANVLIFLSVNLPLGQRPADPRDPRLAEYVAVLREMLPPGTDLRDAASGLTAYDLFVFEHGFRPSQPQTIDLFTSMFLHGGFMHLFGNMLFLWIYGNNVEHRLGWFRYIVAYLLTGVAAVLAFWAVAPGSKLPMIGASGAISGVLGFYFVWFPRNVVRMLVFLIPLMVNVIEIPARIVLGIYLIIDNLLPMLIQGSGGGGVAHGAHIGGFVAGLGIAWVMNRSAETSPPPDFRRRPARPPPLPGAFASGDMQSAARAYFAQPTIEYEAQVRPEDARRLGAYLTTNGQLDAALRVFLRQIRAHERGPDAAAAHLGAGQILLQQGQVATAYQHLRQALELDPTPETDAAARQALSAIAAAHRSRALGF